jgi:hypothetical protein
MSNDDEAMKCGRCGLVLRTTGGHSKPEDCIEALRTALDDALVCTQCKTELTGCCLKCEAKRWAIQKGIEQATKVGMAAWEKLQQQTQPTEPERPRPTPRRRGL